MKNRDEARVITFSMLYAPFYNAVSCQNDLIISANDVSGFCPESDRKAEVRHGSPTNVLHARKSHDKLSMNMRGTAMSYNHCCRVRPPLHVHAVTHVSRMNIRAGWLASDFLRGISYHRASISVLQSRILYRSHSIDSFQWRNYLRSQDR